MRRRLVLAESRPLPRAEAPGPRRSSCTGKRCATALEQRTASPSAVARALHKPRVRKGGDRRRPPLCAHRKHAGTSRPCWSYPARLETTRQLEARPMSATAWSTSRFHTLRQRTSRGRCDESAARPPSCIPTPSLGTCLGHRILSRAVLGPAGKPKIRLRHVKWSHWQRCSSKSELGEADSDSGQILADHRPRAHVSPTPSWTANESFHRPAPPPYPTPISPCQ